MNLRLRSSSSSSSILFYSMRESGSENPLPMNLLPIEH